MVEETNDNQVSVAFNLVLDELPKARANLVRDLTAAAERGDYEAVVNLWEITGLGRARLRQLQRGR